MSAAGSRSRYWAWQLVLLVGLGYLLALMLILTGPWLSGSRHSSLKLVMRAAAGSSNTSEHGCSKSQVATPSPADSMAAPTWPPSVPTAPWQFSGVFPGAYSESDTTLTPWCNATFSKQHPLTPADYERSFKPGGNCSMPHELYDVLESGSRELVITVVGGSMTLGTNCLPSSNPDEWDPSCPKYDRHCNNLLCSWPSKMQTRLQQLFPAGRISLRNKARPSWSYTNWVEAGVIDMLVETDVLIIDLQVNSQVYRQDTERQMEEVDLFIHNVLAAADRQQRSIGIMFVESFATCGNLTALCDVNCPEDRQGRMNYSFAGVQQPFGWCNRFWKMASTERPIVEHYKLPTASYRDAVWPSLPNPSPLLPCFWNGFNHPDAVGHLLMADVVAYGLVRSLLSSSRNAGGACHARPVPVKFHKGLASMRYCTPPSAPGVNASSSQGTYMTPAQPASFQPLGIAGPWIFREDKPGKPGWIFEPGFKPANTLEQPRSGQSLSSTSSQPTVAGAAMPGPRMLPPGNVSNLIWFKVMFSSQPQLQVTYLTSYKSIGVAELAIYNSNAIDSALGVYTLDGRVKGRYSVPQTTVLVHPLAPGKTRGRHVVKLPNQVRQGGYVVAVRPVNGTNLQGSKFKLLGVSSC